MSMQDLNDAAGAQNALTARMNAFLNNIDADISTRQAAYTNLVSDLNGVVNAQMYFTGTIDPDEANPTNVDGGTFTTIKSFAEAAPSGAYLLGNLVAGKTHLVDARIVVRAKSIHLKKRGAGNDPVVVFSAFAAHGFNTLASFMPDGLCYFKFSQCNINIPTAKVDGALPWSSFTGIVAFDVAAPLFLSLQSCLVTGGMAGVELGLVASSAANFVSIGLHNTELSGPMFGVCNSVGATAAISVFAVTLSSGAALIGPSVPLGSNYLTNFTA